MAAPLRFHWAKLRAMCHATEDLGRVVQAMSFVAAQNPSEFGPGIRKDAVESHHGGTFHILEGRLEKSREAKDLLKRVLALPGAQEKVLAKLDAKVDEDGILFVRVEKQAAYLGQLRLTDGDDCVQLRFRVEAYPATREAIVAALRASLGSPGHEPASWAGQQDDNSAAR